MRWIPASALLASLALATVPFTLTSGVPAKASQVNRNFMALDSLLVAQVEQLGELREALILQTDSLRKELAQMRQKSRIDSAAMVERILKAVAADTAWKPALAAHTAIAAPTAGIFQDTAKAKKGLDSAVIKRDTLVPSPVPDSSHSSTEGPEQ